MTTGSVPQVDPAAVGPGVPLAADQDAVDQLPLFGSHVGDARDHDALHGPGRRQRSARDRRRDPPGRAERTPTPPRRRPSASACAQDERLGAHQRRTRHARTCAAGARNAAGDAESPTRPRPLGQHRAPRHGRDPARLRAPERLRPYPNDTLRRAIAHHRHARSTRRMTGTPLVYPTDVGHRRDQVLRRRRRRDHLEVRRRRAPTRASGPASCTSTSTTRRRTRTRDRVERRAAVPGHPGRCRSIPRGERRAQRGDRHDADVRHDRHRVRLLDHREGRRAPPPKLRAQRQLVARAGRDATSAIGFDPGERVSGPMTVFNGTLYFSTYAAPPARRAVVHERHRASVGARLRHAGRPTCRRTSSQGRSASPRCSRRRRTPAGQPSAHLDRAADVLDRGVRRARSSLACAS